MESITSNIRILPFAGASLAIVAAVVGSLVYMHVSEADLLKGRLKEPHAPLERFELLPADHLEGAFSQAAQAPMEGMFAGANQVSSSGIAKAFSAPEPKE